VNTFGLSGLKLKDRTLKTRKLDTSENQFELFKRLYALYDKAFIFESLVGPKELAETSILGFDPELAISCDSEKLTVAGRDSVLAQYDVTEPLSQLRNIMPQVQENQFRFVGGAVGYISYDAIRFWERLPAQGKKRSVKNKFPLLEFGIYTDGILYNHIENQAYYFSVGKSRFEYLQQLLRNSQSESDSSLDRFCYSTPRRNMTKRHFTDMVLKAKKYIYDGDIFQVVLAKSMKFDIQGNIISLYESLREVNPSPYMYFVKMSDRCIVGSSPEMLVRVTGSLVETFPIAGTRPVSNNQQENEKLCRDLLADEKEVAEHTMLVDLARNDIGRICKFGTVTVNELMTVKRFSHVQHIVSHVTGRIDKNRDSFDALRAVFPAGTVSGAPKVRAMEIIDELEPELRQAYAGAVGYFSFNGCCDFAIAIRSLFINKNKAYIQSGAGIVMDSDPEKEWQETEHKAGAMLLALRRAARKGRSARQEKKKNAGRQAD